MFRDKTEIGSVWNSYENGDLEVANNKMYGIMQIK